MRFRIANRQDFCAGVFFMSVGIATMLLSLSYRIGTAGRMGPGFFPMALGGILTAVGLIVSVQGVARVKEDVSLPPLSFRPLFLVLGSVALFGVLLNSLGFVLCTAILVGTSSFAYHEPRWREIVLSAAALTVFSLAVFGYGLSLPFPLWPKASGWN
ncbi:MAG TPA: tripartite tricarboxylate transporter TctB family protein [Burkholderiales bacterium]|nr:tripartite tricarboxylate transporter TctB family protein [Burkholderiales bacterium]